VIFHTCAAPVEIGAEVTGVIDWERRFDHMQQHSGEHICSGMICETFHCDNVGFHMGADMVTIDFNTEISWEQLMEIEQRANRYIYENHPIDIQFYRGEALAAVEYRSKKELEGDVRIVAFPGADCCACCGTHVLRAGQVGLVKVLSCQKFRSGVRIELLCGSRALRYLSACFDQAKTVSQKFSTKPTEILRAVEKLEKDLVDARARITELESIAWDAIAREHEGEENVLLIRPPMGGDSLRRLADTVAHKTTGTTALFAGENERWAYALLRADGADISPFVKAMNAALHGRGGGRNGFAQGSVEATQQQILDYFSAHS
jgi:alanyl-tRNA synthetase